VILHMNSLSVSRSTVIAAALAAALASAGCTMKNQEAPPLTGPSEFGTSITITVSPDVLTQDGASQSLVTITVRDQFGNPLPNLSLRAEIFSRLVILDADGNPSEVFVPGDFGSLSARSLVTDANGRATLVYTAPASPAGPFDSNAKVQIVVTPVGTDFGNTSSRTATIRLVPTGVVTPPDGLRPNFTPLDGATFTDQETIVFDASTSTSPLNNPIVSYTWDFGDGQSGSGRTITHTYARAGAYNVRLTITDGLGRSAQTTHVIILGEGAKPTAAFTVSPSDPTPNQPVSFNASGSTAAPGHRVVNYSWDFGDGTTFDGGSSPRASKPTGYAREGTNTVTLVVTDEAGKTDSEIQPVAVKFPTTLKAPTVK
jgi:PKD repeat protein